MSQPLRALTEAELFNVPAPEWEIENRTEQGGFNVVTGPRGSYKTLLIAALALAVTRGGNWFTSRVVRTGPVMVVPLEDLRGWRKRWEAARTTAGVETDARLPIYTWPHPVNLFTGAGVEALLRDLERLHIVHVVFDPWADAIAGADENSQKDVGIAIDRVKQLRSHCRSVTIVHHTGHDESRERGSTVLGGATDTMMLMKRDREAGDRCVSIECSKQRNGERFAPIRLTFDADALVLRPAPVSLLPTLPRQQQVVLDALRKLAVNNGAGVGIHDWQARCLSIEGVKRRTFFDSKKKLIEGDHVEESENGKFRPA